MRAESRELIDNAETPPKQSSPIHQVKPRPCRYYSKAERRQRVYFDAFLTCFRAWEEISAALGSARGATYHGSGGHTLYAPCNPLTYRLLDYRIDFEKCCRDAISPIEHDSHIRALLNGRTDLSNLPTAAMLAYANIGKLCMVRGVHIPSRYLNHNHRDDRQSAYATQSPYGEPVTRGKRVSTKDHSALGDRDTWNVGTADVEAPARRVRVPRGFQVERLPKPVAPQPCETIAACASRVGFGESE